MTSISLGSTGATVVTTAKSYFYSAMTDEVSCYSVVTATAFKIMAVGMIANNGSLKVNMGFDAAFLPNVCKRTNTQILEMSNWTIDPVTGYEVGLIQLSSYNLVDFTRMMSVAFESPIQPVGIPFTLH
jgi:hypothetical protein